MSGNSDVLNFEDQPLLPPPPRVKLSIGEHRSQLQELLGKYGMQTRELAIAQVVNKR